MLASSSYQLRLLDDHLSLPGRGEVDQLSVQHGSALASFTCEKFGIERLVEITREDIDERIQQFVDLVDFDIELVEG